MSAQRVPVVLLAGFLGAGKTTLLNHLLGSQAARIGVIVNDFGAINVDAITVAGHVDSMISLGDGCLCCAVDTAGIDEMLARLTDPEAGIDVIVIESSGLAEPAELIRLVVASSNPQIVYGGLVQVVDAVEFEGLTAAHPELIDQLAVADLVVLNKADRVGADRLRGLEERIRKAASDVPVMPTEYARVPVELLLDPRGSTQTEEIPGQLCLADVLSETEHADHAHEAHPHAAYDAVTFSTGWPLNPRRLVEFLERGVHGLYRIKGDLYFGVPGYTDRFRLQTVGWYVRIEREPWRSEEPANRLVLIGAGIDTEAVTAALRTCIEPAPETLGEQDLMGILRFVDDDPDVGDRPDRVEGLHSSEFDAAADEPVVDEHPAR